MAEYRRYRVPGGSVFFTVVTRARRPLFRDAAARTLLGRVTRECKGHWPFHLDAMVLLPDHLHAIWTLPSGDDAYSRRWGWIKKEFTKAWLATGGTEARLSTPRRLRRDRGVWQPRFWEHTLRDEEDFERHLDYIHYNPVKHGLANCPADWKPSSFRRWAARGVYPSGWGCASRGVLSFDDIGDTTGE